MNFVQVLLLFSLIFNFSNSNPLTSKSLSCGYENCPKVDDNKINIHLVPHSHDDVGWLQTFDGYYQGVDGRPTSNYERAGVQYILDSTLKSLKSNPNRRYIQVETSYLWKWWQLQDDSTKKDYVDLVNSGQIEIINGGWSMNDEAATHYHSIIDQFTWGFRKLSEIIGTTCAIPRIGWQIDPFGHSREHASISKQLGFDGLIIGRIDFRDKNTRISNRSLDFKWKTSENLENNEIFTSMFPDFYVSVKGFCFDITCHDTITDDNLSSKVKDFADVMSTYRNYYQTNNILIPMGGDFNFQIAEQNFASIDKLIQGFENHPDYNVFYSSPSCYVKSVNEQVKKNSIELPEKCDDFFPYASGHHEFWTGYFTSRPTSKRFERLGNNILQTAKQLAAFSKSLSENAEDSIENLRSAMGIMQHHDAITGTEKQKVAEDYARILSEAISQAEVGISQTASNILRNSETDKNLNLKFCLLSNVSICDTSTASKFVVAVYNPLGKTVSHYVRLPVQDSAYQVNGPDGEEASDIVDPMSTFDYIPQEKSPRELVFAARDLPPLGLKLYLVEQVDSSKKRTISFTDENDDFTFGTKTNGFSIDPNTNLLNSITINGEILEVSQELLYYVANGGIGGKPSGAYVFRPSDENARQFTTTAPELQSQRGDLVDEVRQKFADNIIQIIRVYKDDQHDFIELDWLVGDLENNQEVITRFKVKDFASEGVFYTDSNGREQMKRILNRRSDYEYDSSEEPVTGNYYPITSKISIKDEDRNLQVAVLNDRAQGGSSLRDGEIELMLHRRLTRDDGYGVGEALNEQQFNRGLFARGQHYLTFGPIKSKIESDKSTSVKERELALSKLLAPTVLLGQVSPDQTLEDLQKEFDFEFAGLLNDLPDNVHILTLEPWEDDGYLLRLEHFIEKGEDDVLSEPVSVNLGDLFQLFEIAEITETYLGANQDLSKKSEKLIWGDALGDTKDSISENMEIILNPMQIRTFLIKINPAHNPIPYNVNRRFGVDLI